MYDIIIIGAGPGGLTAAIYAGRGGLDTLVLDSKQVGGTVNEAPLIENYPGFDAIVGKDLVEKISAQAKMYSTIKEFVDVEEISKEDEIFTVKTGDESFEAKSIILATGTTVKTLDVPGVSEYTGRGISYCAVCDGNFFVDREVLVIGGGNSAAVEALYLNNIGVKCSLVHRRDKLRCDKKLQEDLEKNNIPIYWNCELKEVRGNVMLEEAVLHDNKEDSDISVNVNGIFISIGYDANNKLALESDIECNDAGYIVVDDKMKTSKAGIYAVGDITGQVKQIAVAVGQAAIASSDIISNLI